MHRGDTVRAVIEELLGPLSAARLMRGINPRQAAFLEAIGFGLDTVDLVYRRLAATLRGLDPAPSPLIFADAWAIMDWRDRIDSGPATHPSATAPSARLSAHGWARSRS